MRLETITRMPKKQTHKTPLLFVHGMWHGAWCWDEFFLPYFAEQGYHVTALSLRGHAGSEGKIRGCTIEEYVRDVEQIAKTLDTPPVVIGHSMGGFLTQKYLERNDAPTAVLLSSAPHYGLWPALFHLVARRPLVVLKALVQWRMRPVVETPEAARWALFSADMPKKQMLKYYKRLNDESFRMFIDLLGLNLAHPKKVKTPLLILGAEKDNAIPPSQVHVTARAYGVRAEIFPNMAHDMMLEKDWESVAKRILDWLNERGV
ncbi:AB hydrolase superfamily protein YdjP [Anaerolineales bacterium]|nr:AB hydrolase superfamily protein YdjP [Anaerolineales bacterium]